MHRKDFFEAKEKGLVCEKKIRKQTVIGFPDLKKYDLVFYFYDPIRVLLDEYL